MEGGGKLKHRLPYIEEIYDMETEEL